MSRKSKRAEKQRHRQAAGAAPGLAQETEIQQPTAYGWGSGYSGANRSTSRAEVPWWNLDTSKDLDSYSYMELVRKTRWLFANDGKIKGAIGTSADSIGWKTPQPITSDPAWNKEAIDEWEDRAQTPGAFEISGKFDWWDAQPMLFKLAFRDSAALVVFTSSESGQAMFAFYPITQLANPDTGTPGWQDGILTNKNGRHIAYGIRGAEGKVVVVTANDAHYFGEFDDPQQVHPVPPMAHAINHALDRTEVRSDTKKAIKGAALNAVIRTRETNAPPGKDLSRGLPGPPGTRPTPDGTGTYNTVKVFEGGQMIDLEPGEKADILHDARPSPNQMAFLGSLADDIIDGFGPPAAIFNGINDLTGPAIRCVMDTFERWMVMRSGRMETLLRRMWVYSIAKEMKYGNLRRPGKGVKWWKVRFAGMRNLTIDRSQLKNRMDVVDAGYDTAENFCEEFFGANADDVDDAHIARIARRKAKCEELGVDYAEAYPPRAGTAVAPAAEDPATPEPPPEPKKKAKP